MMTALKNTTTEMPDTRRPWPARPSVTKPASPPLPASARPNLVEVKAQPTSASVTPAPNSFEADLAREMVELRGYALWLCRSSSLAEDLIQETLLKAWSARDSFQAGTNLKAWCTTILRNVFFSYKRRSWRSLPLPDEMIADLAAEDVDSGHRLDLLALRNAIALLPRDQREALLLVGAGGQSYIEAAKVCACAVGTVKSRVSRARIRLAALMAENKAGFNSDSSLNADEALNDLMAQATRIKGRADKVSVGSGAQKHSSPVFTEAG